MNTRVMAACDQSVSLLQRYCREQGDGLVQLAQHLAALFAADGQLLIAASANMQTIARQLASQFVFRLSFERPALPALCLGNDQILRQRMASAGRADQIMLRHYRAINSDNHLVLILSDGGDSGALSALAEEVQENGQKLALLCADRDHDELAGLDVGICIDLGTDSPPRRLELAQFSGHLLCELVEAELFGA